MSNWKVLQKTILLKFGTKNTLFGYQHLQINTFKFFNLENFAKKTIMSNFGTKPALFGHFWAGILIKYCYI